MCRTKLHARQYRRGPRATASSDSSIRRRAGPAADPMRSTDAAAAGNRSCSHDFLSFVSGVSAWPARWDGGNDCLAGQPAASGRPCNVFFQPEIVTFLFVSFLLFHSPGLTGRPRTNTPCFAECGMNTVPDYRPVKCLARPHMNLWDMRSTLCSLRAGAHPRGFDSRDPIRDSVLIAGRFRDWPVAMCGSARESARPRCALSCGKAREQAGCAS